MPLFQWTLSSEVFRHMDLKNKINMTCDRPLIQFHVLNHKILQPKILLEEICLFNILELLTNSVCDCCEQSDIFI